MPTTFFDLPRELRDQIYDYILISPTGLVTILPSPNYKAKRSDKQARSLKTLSKHTSPNKSKPCFSLFTDRPSISRCTPSHVVSKEFSTSLSIRRVCRQIYDETQDIFWPTNQIYFPDFKPLPDNTGLGVVHTLNSMGQTASRMIVSMRIDMPDPSPAYSSFGKVLNALNSRARHGAFRRLELTWGGNGRSQAAVMFMAYMLHIEGGNETQPDVKGFVALLNALRQGAEACKYERVMRCVGKGKSIASLRIRDYDQVSALMDGAAEMLTDSFGGSFYWGDTLAWMDGKRIISVAELLMKKVREQKDESR